MLERSSAHCLLMASFRNNFCTFVALLLHFRCTFSAIQGDDLLCNWCSFIQHTRVLSQCKVQVVTSPRNLHRKEKVKLWVSSGIPGKRKLVNLSATMLSTEFAAVGQIFADEQPADAFYGWAASCFIDGTKKGFSNCLDSWLHQTVSPQLAKTSSYSWEECHVKVDTLPDLRQCNLSTQRSRDSVENCHNFGTKANDWEQPKSVSFSLEISNLPFSSSTLDLEGVLIRVESIPSCTDARQVDGDTNTSAPTIFDTVWPVFLTSTFLVLVSAFSLTPTFGSTQSITVLFPLLADLSLAPAPLSQPDLSSNTSHPPLSPLGPCLTCGWKYEDGASLPNLGWGGGPTVLIQPMVAAAFKGPAAADAMKVRWRNDQRNPAPPSSSLAAPQKLAVVTWYVVTAVRHWEQAEEQRMGRGGRSVGRMEGRVSPSMRLRLVMQRRLWAVQPAAVVIQRSGGPAREGTTQAARSARAHSGRRDPGCRISSSLFLLLTTQQGSWLTDKRWASVGVNKMFLFSGAVFGWWKHVCINLVDRPTQLILKYQRHSRAIC